MPHLLDGEWILVEENSASGRARRSAANLADRLGFSESRAGEVAIAATELATNLQRHARQGVLFVRAHRQNDEAAVELIALDSGPGVADINQLLSDGYSTRGTLGIGLGAVTRLATWFDVHSVPGRGTVIVATFWKRAAPSPPPVIAALTRPMNGEYVCGDAWGVRDESDCTMLLLADGLGHGELAAMAGREAVRAFHSQDGITDVMRSMQGIDAALHSTRGAAVGILRIDRAGENATFAGIGNISVWIDDGERRQGLISTPGIVGHSAKRVRPVDVRLPKHAIVVMHSDGLTSKWDLNLYPGLRSRDRRLVAATLFRDAGVHHDDASILVA